MYTFYSPFGIDFKTFSGFRFTSFLHIKPYVAVLNLENISIDFSKEGLKSVQAKDAQTLHYSFTIKDGLLKERLRLEDTQEILLESFIEKKIETEFIDKIMTIYGISIYDRLPGGFQSSSITFKAISEAIKESEKLEMKDGSICLKENKEIKLSLFAMNEGFYYVAPFFGDYYVRYFNLAFIHERERKNKKEITSLFKDCIENYTKKNKLRIILQN